MDDWHAAAIFEREDLVRVDATVRRVGGSYVSVTLPEPYAAASFKALDVPVEKGATIAVAGMPDPRLDVDRLKGFRVMVVRVPFAGSVRHVLIEKPDVMREAAQPLHPSWVDALVRHGLLEKDRVDAEQRKKTPLPALMSIHGPREALARGFVHFASDFRTDTDDVVRDFALIAGAPDAFRSLAIRDDALDLQIRLPDGSVEKETVAIGPGKLDVLADRINHWLEKSGFPRRIFSWKTADERLAYIGRTPEEIEALKRDGVAESHPIELPTAEPVRDEMDWSDL